MIHRSTANALNARATKAIPKLVRWFEYLRVELGNQRPLTRPVGAYKYVDDVYPEFIELRRVDVERLLDDLREIRRELTRYSSA
jgi:hypothetical protein